MHVGMGGIWDGGVAHPPPAAKGESEDALDRHFKGWGEKRRLKTERKTNVNVGTRPQPDAEERAEGGVDGKHPSQHGTQTIHQTTTVP